MKPIDKTLDPRQADNGGAAADAGPIAMAYVPAQVWNGISDPAAGLKNGTVFPELVKPFCPHQRRRP